MLKQVLQEIEQRQRFLLTSHARPMGTPSVRHSLAARFSA